MLLSLEILVLVWWLEQRARPPTAAKGNYCLQIDPNSTNDMSISVSELAKFHCQFAIRGGGHMLWAGSANVAGGMIIDLSSFTSVSVSKDRKTTSAGGERDGQQSIPSSML
ncbi:MAG: hypothetical protein Q9175_005349 [Cornicularia normoerica]